MISALVFATTFAYSFATGTTTKFDVNVEFEGYLPLLGGKNGKANVEMKVDARGIPTTMAGATPAMASVESEIESLSVKLNSNALPLTKDNIDQFFPKSVVVIEPNGKVIENSAPKRKLPVKLPGLDSQRFPDISFLPVLLPETPLSEGESYTFKKLFNGSNVAYNVTFVKAVEGKAELKIVLDQDTTEFEDEYRNPVDEEKDATSKVESHLSGEGTATFDLKRGVFLITKIEATNVSKIINLKTQAQTDRKLKTTLLIKISEPAAPLQSVRKTR